ncbi:MAG: hypothetical protein JWM59_1937 [Verrucomicrobiales bacterium]|nr:hypothetical protein [Verrucomicrobiales bacterium]
MKTLFYFPRCVLVAALLILTGSMTYAGRTYGVSSSPAGRGTQYQSSRGGSAYVGPRGVAVQGADGRAGAVTRNGKAYVGPNGAAVSTRPVYPPKTVVVSKKTVVVAKPLPSGYIRAVPAGYTTVVYRGYSCRYVGGIYYRSVMYQGGAVWIIVK